MSPIRHKFLLSLMTAIGLSSLSVFQSDAVACERCQKFIDPATNPRLGLSKLGEAPPAAWWCDRPTSAAGRRPGGRGAPGRGSPGVAARV